MMLSWWRGAGAREGDDSDFVVQLAVAGSQISQAMATADARLGRKGLSQVQRLLRRVRTEARRRSHEVESQPSSVVRFIVDGLFLMSSYRYVCGHNGVGARGTLEVFHYVCGLRLDDGTFVMGHIVPVAFAEQTVVRVRVTNGSNISALEKLDQLGLPLTAHIHSHPGKGPGATYPSITDRRFQERLERGGHVAIGGIFAPGERHEAFVRFFAGDSSRFEIDVRGNNVEEVENNVYRLRLADSDVPIGNDSTGRQR
jgi:hypothetical protein